jgi:drug/metabolite transporter (DMT)-like permease
VDVMARWRGELAVAGAAIGFGVGTSLSVVALRTLRPADLLVVELLGSALVLVTAAASSGRLHRRGAFRALAQGAVSPGLSFLLGDLGLARTSATSGSLLLGTDTLVTVLLAVLVLRERVRPAESTALAFGLGGTVLVALGTATSPTPGSAASSVVGNLLVVAAVLCSAVYVVWSRRSAGTPDEGVGITAWQFAGAATATLPFVVGSWATGGSRLGDARPEELLAAAAVLLCGLGALTLFNLGIGAVTASRAGLLFSLQPAAGAATALVVLGESVGVGQTVGGALIVLGVLVLARSGWAETTGREMATCDRHRHAGGPPLGWLTPEPPAEGGHP